MNNKELVLDEKELIELIDKLEQEYARYLKIYFHSKELEMNMKYINKKVIQPLKKIKKSLRVMQEQLDKYGYDGSIYNNISYNIINLDSMFNTYTYNYFYKLKIEKDPKKKLKLYRKVYVDLIEKYNNLGKKDYKNRRITKNLIELLRIKILREKAKVRALLQNEKLEENKIVKPIKIKSKEEKRNYVDITDKDILNNGDIKEVMYSFRNMIEKSPITTDFIEYTSTIRSRLINEEVMDDNYELINSLVDRLKYRKLELKKSNKQEKKIIRQCSNILEELSEQIRIKNTVIAEPHDYKFDIVFELLRDKKNYSLIKKMVNDYPSIVNVRNNKRSILSYMLQLYLNNYKMILNEHKYNYNIDYIKEVYRLFSNSNSLYLSFEDKLELDSILDEFIYEVSELDINSKKKNYVINEAKGLYIESIMHKEENYLKDIDKYEFDENIKDIKFSDPNHSNIPVERDLTHEHTFMLNSPYVCYSYVEEKGVEKLKIHTTDISNIVDKGTALDKYVYNCMLENKKINKTLSDYLTFKKGEVVTAFTYEIVFDKDRSIKNFIMYPSRIKVDGDILDYGNNKYVYINLRKIVTDYIQKNGDNSLSGLNKIEYIINDMLNKQYIKYSRNQNLPIVATKENKLPAMDPETFSKIQKAFNKLPMRDYKRLSKVFEDDIVEKYYDNKVNYKENNNLSLYGTPNYIYLLNQRMLKELITPSIRPENYSKVKQNIVEEYESLINVLNEKVGYKKEEDFDYKKRRNFKTYILKNEE